MKATKILILLFSICFLTSKELIEEESAYETNDITIDDFNVDISKENCTIVIDNLVKLFQEGYVYTDIKKNPPNKEYFGSADIIGELRSVSVEGRKYYDFVRDIKKIIGKFKDGHLYIAALKSPNGYNLQQMTFCLPFSFYIKGENRADAKIYIKKYDKCFQYFTKDVQDFVLNHEEKYLKQVNDTDPFDFIQKIGEEFNTFYNRHSIFTYYLKIAHSINIARISLSQEQISNITFVFEDDNNITLNYYLYYNTSLEKDEEFMNFYNKEIQNQPKIMDISILEIENKYHKMKNNLEQRTESNIDWDYSSIDNLIQCRVDRINKLNVFKQTSFSFFGDNYKNGLEIVENCTELFYSNDFPIVGIESYNGGGTCKISYYFQELLQVKILPVPHYTTLKSQLMKQYVEANIPDITEDRDMDQRIDIKTCKPFEHFDDMEEVEDDYGEGVKHKRTQFFRVFNSSDLKKHKAIREKYYKLNKLKRPTDIIIFTDTFSFSATSFFIKGLQETGGVIVVGYFGNPKSDEVMDASQSPSFVGTFSNTDVAKNLKERGFEIKGVTIYESYNYTYQESKHIPREYLIHPVDEKFDLFEFYDDTLYDKFMTKAKEIFKKYNDEGKCSPNNLNLLYDPNNQKDCYTFPNDEHAHGGYECNATTGTWSNICRPYYCDIGYYFDLVQNKCIKDICTEEEEVKPEPQNEGQIMAWNAFKAILYLLIILW